MSSLLKTLKPESKAKRVYRDKEPVRDSAQGGSTGRPSPLLPLSSAQGDVRKAALLTYLGPGAMPCPNGRGGQKSNGVRRQLLTQLLPPPGSFRVIQGQSSPISLGRGGGGRLEQGSQDQTRVPRTEAGFQD